MVSGMGMGMGHCIEIPYKKIESKFIFTSEKRIYLNIQLNTIDLRQTLCALHFVSTKNVH
jgi:hypothetical protein